MKILKKFAATICATIMVVSTMSMGILATEPQDVGVSAINDFKSVSKEKIVDFFVENDRTLYNIEGFEFEDGDVSIEGNQIFFSTTAIVRETLKANSVDELPYVAGYMSAFGISSYENISDSAKRHLIQNAIELDNEYLTIGQIGLVDNTVSLVDKTAAVFKEYIGETNEYSYGIKASMDLDDLDNINKNSITLMAISDLEGTYDISVYAVRSAEELFQNGQNDALAKIQEITVNPNWVANPIDNWSIYNRIAARDYAYRYYKNYNSAYTKYSSDCANFVSQCLYAGGVPTSSEWRKDTTTWIRVKELRPYMVNNGYATRESYTNATAGSFATTTSEGHAVLITLNDGAKVAYTAHTRDVKNQVISTYGNFKYYVIKNY